MSTTSTSSLRTGAQPASRSTAPLTRTTGYARDRTSIQTAIASASGHQSRAEGLGDCFAEELGEHVAHTAVHVGDDGPDLLDALPGRIGELPIEVALAGEERACVSAPH